MRVFFYGDNVYDGVGVDVGIWEYYILINYWVGFYFIYKEMDLERLCYLCKVIVIV